MRTLVDLGLTRDQGEGIPRMFAEMEDAFLPAPRIEPTARNVSVVLGNTTTLTEADRTFVERLAAEELTQEEFRALLQAHRNSQVDNASLRQLMGLDTLAASQVLRRLRDRSMLELHRAGAQSFYTLDPGLLAGDRPGQGNLVLDRGGLAADRGGIPADRGRIGPDRGELPTDRGELPADRGESGPIPSTVTGGDILDLDPALHQALASLGTRPRKEKLRQVIGLLCSDQWRTGAWLAQLLSYKPGNLANRHLGPMVKEGTLERRFPEKPNHPEQAYRSIPTPPPAIRVNLEREAQP
jgi:ATP-dependent DNA helicase RecG